MASPPRRPRGEADARPHPLLGSYFRTLSDCHFPCVAYAVPPSAPRSFRLHYHEPVPPSAIPLPQMDTRFPAPAQSFFCIIAPHTFLGPVEGLDHVDDSTYILVSRWWICIWTSFAGGRALAIQLPVHVIQDWIRQGWHIGWDHWHFYSRLLYPSIIRYARRGIPLPHLNAVAPLHLLSGPAWIRLQLARQYLTVRPGDLYPFLDFPLGWRAELDTSSDDEAPARNDERLARRRVRFVLRRMILWHRAKGFQSALCLGTLRGLFPQLHAAEPALLRIAMFAQSSIRTRLSQASVADLIFGPIATRPPRIRWLVYERQRALDDWVPVGLDNDLRPGPRA